MSLAEHQAKVARVCLEAEPSELGSMDHADRWSIYRTMVRARLHRVCEQALKRTREALGEEAFRALVDRWLASAPPSTRFFRELPGEFVAWVDATECPEMGTPTFARDMMRYELAVWSVKADDERGEPSVVDFSFEGIPCFSVASRFVRVAHGVDRRAEDGSVDAHDGALLVYRTAGFTAKCLRLNPLAAALVEELRQAESARRSVTEAVQRAAQKQGVAIDQKLIEGLSGLLEKLLTRGVLRGCLEA